ncbi:MAG: DUF4382 domain-containing protein [Cyanobacteria bacterium J06573_11]
MQRSSLRHGFSGYKKAGSLCVSAILLGGLLVGCSQSDRASNGTGTLLITANGEDFVRQGFTDKDGWQISFDHVYITLADITASQVEPPFDITKTLNPTAQVKVPEPITVDLAAGDENADPVTVASVEPAPAGRYTALGWQVITPESGPAAGYPLVMIGTATKAEETIAFQIQLADELTFQCGDFVGEERKGILEQDETADVEATFHFDHFFGDGEAPADDEINTGALGFEPLAALATDGELTIDSEGLKSQLSAEDYEAIQALLPSLGHVGEGHCEVIN